MPGGTTKEIEIEFKMSPIPPSRDVPLDLALIPLDDVFSVSITEFFKQQCSAVETK